MGVAFAFAPCSLFNNFTTVDSHCHSRHPSVTTHFIQFWPSLRTYCHKNNVSWEFFFFLSEDYDDNDLWVSSCLLMTWNKHVQISNQASMEANVLPRNSIVIAGVQVMTLFEITRAFLWSVSSDVEIQTILAYTYHVWLQISKQLLFRGYKFKLYVCVCLWKRIFFLSLIKEWQHLRLRKKEDFCETTS